MDLTPSALVLCVLGAGAIGVKVKEVTSGAAD